jgi:hypothetical protein
MYSKVTNNPSTWPSPSALLLGFSTSGAARFTHDRGFIEGSHYVDRVNSGRLPPTGWTIGDRCRMFLFAALPVFLVRTGQVNPGVIMSGVLTSGRIELQPGANRVLVQWQRAIRWREQEALSLESVFGPRRGKSLRSALQQSGVPINPAETRKLATRWARFTKLAKLPVQPRRSDRQDSTEDLVVIEGRRVKRDASRYSRYRELRARLLAKQHPPMCAVCRQNPAHFYGAGIGDILEAHHLIPLSCGKRTTKEGDVRLVCPNCHRALHATTPPLDIARLRKIIRDRRCR